MSVIKIKDKTFKVSIPEAEILKKVKVVADRINKDMAEPVVARHAQRLVRVRCRPHAYD